MDAGLVVMAIRAIPMGVAMAPAPAVVAVGVGVIVNRAPVVVIRVTRVIAVVRVSVIRPVSRPKVAGYYHVRL